MQILGSRTYKKVGDVLPGELISCDIGGSPSLGIVLASPDGEPLVAALSDPHEGHPRIIRLSKDDACVSHGSDWLIEPIEGKESFPWLHEVNRRSGLLALNASGWMMSVATSGVDHIGRVSLSWFTLEPPTLIAEKPNRSSFYDHWRLWPSEAERASGKSEPLFEFHAAPRLRQP
jgi:hypothetical protein